MKFIIYMFIGVVFWYFVGFVLSREEVHRKKYLPIKDNNIEKEQKDYVVKELNKYKEFAQKKHMYTLIIDIDRLTEKMRNERLNVYEINMINQLLGEFHSQLSKK